MEIHSNFNNRYFALAKSYNKRFCLLFHSELKNFYAYDKKNYEKLSAVYKAAFQCLFLEREDLYVSIDFDIGTAIIINAGYVKAFQVTRYHSNIRELDDLIESILHYKLKDLDKPRKQKGDLEFLNLIEI